MTCVSLRFPLAVLRGDQRMPGAYSDDLQRKLLEAYEAGAGSGEPQGLPAALLLEDGPGGQNRRDLLGDGFFCILPP